MMERARIAGRGPGPLLAALCAVACGAPPPPGAGSAETAAQRRAAAARAAASAARPRALSYLQDDHERIFPERVRLAHYGEVRYAARDAGDVAGDGDRSDQVEMSESPSLVVVDQVLDRVRVISQQDRFRLLLWIDVDDVYTVLTERVTLEPDTGGGSRRGTPDEHGAALLHPGLPVHVDGERDAMAHIRHRDECVSLSGLVPRAALGSQFVPIETGERQVNALVGAGTPVFDRPGGKQIARFLSDCEVTDTGAESDGHRPILYATEWMELRGWVAAQSGKASGNGSASSWGYGLGQLGLWGSRSRVRLTEGTCLYARRGGPAIGVVTEDAEAPLTPPVKGWWQVPIETGWGDLTVWVAQERARPEQDRREERPARPEIDAGVGARGSSPADEEDDAPHPELRRCR